MAVSDAKKDVVPLSAQGLWTRRGQGRPMRMPSTADLMQALESVDHTLSEVLVLMYDVVQTNQVLFERLYDEKHQPGAVGGAGRTRVYAGDVGLLMEAETMLKTETTNGAGLGTATPIRPMPTTEDLARSIQALDTTLSEVLVLLYHVVQANHSLVEELRQSRAVASGPRPAELKPLLFAVRTDQ